MVNNTDGHKNHFNTELGQQVTHVAEDIYVGQAVFINQNRQRYYPVYQINEDGIKWLGRVDSSLSARNYLQIRK